MPPPSKLGQITTAILLFTAVYQIQNASLENTAALVIASILLTYSTMNGSWIGSSISAVFVILNLNIPLNINDFILIVVKNWGGFWTWFAFANIVILIERSLNISYSDSLSDIPEVNEAIDYFDRAGVAVIVTLFIIICYIMHILENEISFLVSALYFLFILITFCFFLFNYSRGVYIENRYPYLSKNYRTSFSRSLKFTVFLIFAVIAMFIYERYVVERIITPEDQIKVLDIQDITKGNATDKWIIKSVKKAKNGSTELKGERIEYIPNKDWYGKDIFFCEIVEGENIEKYQVLMEITPKNDDPIGTNDIVNINEDSSIDIKVLKNDTDVDSDELIIESITLPQNGYARIEKDKIFYIPNQNFHGTDNFTYTISDDNNGIDTVMVEVNVASINDNPVGKSDFIEIKEDNSVIIDALENDIDIDGDRLIIESCSTPRHGAVKIDDNKIIYTPEKDFWGTDSLKYSISDTHDGRDRAKIVITVKPVNDAPEAKQDSVRFREWTQTIDVLENDIDTDNDRLTITSCSAPQNGSVEIVSGKILYKPDPDFHGSDVFQYEISDGKKGFSSAEVFIKDAINIKSLLIIISFMLIGSIGIFDPRGYGKWLPIVNIIIDFDDLSDKKTKIATYILLITFILWEIGCIYMIFKIV